MYLGECSDRGVLFRCRKRGPQGSPRQGQGSLHKGEKSYQVNYKGFFKKMGHPRPLFRLFLLSFKQTIQILQQIQVKKCPSSIKCRDLNSQPSNYESSPLTTRPGLPPIYKVC